MYHFRFRLIPFITMLLLVALGVSLANWQTRRAIEKEQIEARLRQFEQLPAVPLPSHIDINLMEFQRVTLDGEFVRNWPIYLDNRPIQGAAGLYVLMPFKLASKPSRVIMIMRGWLPRNAVSRTIIKDYRTPAGIIRIEGILRANSGHILQLGTSAPLTPGSLQQNVDLDEFSRVSGLSVAPFVFEQTATRMGWEDGLVRDWPRASMGSERHRGYAFQWLALAGMALFFFIVTGFKRGKKSATTA